MKTDTAYRAEIAALLTEDRDFRYFDASPDGLARPTNAGESVRYAAARRDRAEALPASVADAVRKAVELSVPKMDSRDLLYTVQALRACPVRGGRTVAAYRSSDQPCYRCNGSGEKCGGLCYRCRGTGREVEEYQRPMRPEEIAADAEYQAGIDARAAREAARKARMAR